MKLEIVEKKVKYETFSYPGVLSDARSKAIHLNDKEALKLYEKLQSAIFKAAEEEKEKLKAKIRFHKTGVLLELLTNRRN